MLIRAASGYFSPAVTMFSFCSVPWPVGASFFFSWYCSFRQVTWNLKVVIIHNFMMVKAVEYFSTIYWSFVFSSENRLFSSIAHLLMRRSGVSLLWELYLNRSLFTLDISYQAQLTKGFFSLSCWQFLLLHRSFSVIVLFLILCNLICQLLELFPDLLESFSENSYLCLYLQIFLLTGSSF